LTVSESILDGKRLLGESTIVPIGRADCVWLNELRKPITGIAACCAAAASGPAAAALPTSAVNSRLVNRSNCIRGL
jgi:hypothetical protein